ncbi:LytTR family DNA-binding domain-containing protein [Paraflavitalea sp. CAU 1676]|uniref:LytR/AlgR family response regulator transcription factor n=1 Tax=Paraflavitalea sp. CAU 1676 TaxID=3032598 RepID=UPI0023DBA25C|nr:LytTR family DNA-binding domain-containing protein [Paraflavitalea sp. CAU 1676]MDF2188855.1 LytTR family DNA-binding domain-containing protein [Paraflavitalea sp. CAU 1676]
MNLKAILIDDEKNNLINLEQLLKTYCAGVEVVDTALNATDGKQLLLQHRPDLLFLDIQMPGKSGFDLLKELPAQVCEVIFVTAYDQYAVQAVRFAAVDYLLKPVNIDELQAAVGRVWVRVRDKQKNLQLENLLQLLQAGKEEHRIAITTLRETRFIRTAEIVRCESSNNYTAIFLSDGEKLTSSRPIFEYEELLRDYGFFRCHQSHLVNRRFVKSWVKEDGGYLLLDNGHQVPVSRNKKELVITALKL